jgi:hypothetical protein
MRAGTGIESVNQPVRLRLQQAQETEVYACEHGHRRVPANVTVTGYCRTCTVLHPNAKRSRWVRHEVAKPQEQPESIADFYLSVYHERQRQKEIAAQQRQQQRRARENQEQAAQKAYELMDATLEEVKIVNSRIAAGVVVPAIYVRELRRLRAERT